MDDGELEDFFNVRRHVASVGNRLGGHNERLLLQELVGLRRVYCAHATANRESEYGGRSNYLCTR